jgi:dihydrodipicolinate synthase/N-acetylneuraminate lyase
MASPKKASGGKFAEFTGVIVPLMLPLNEREEIIKADLVAHVRDLLARGVAGFLVPSGTGEFYTLTTQQRRRAVEIVAGEVKGRAPVISMTAETGTRKALSLIADARAAGADAVMLPPPYYSPIDQETLKRFIVTLADEGGLPVWLYHQPTHTKMSYLPQTVAEFAGHPNIVGIKASAYTDMLYWVQLLRALRDKPHFRLLMGEDFNHLSGLVLGGHGMVSTQANINPDAFVALWKAIEAEDLDAARVLQDKIIDVEERVLARFPNWQGAGKAVLKKNGLFSSTRCAEPCPVLTREQEKEVVSAAKELGLV